MCGIAGFLLQGTNADPELRRRVGSLNTALAHRGPDGEGIWTDGAAGIALAQRRLAIVDLTETGAQPMTSHSGRHVLTYNGEIYNFRELRAKLEAEGVAFNGTSDTEVLLEAWEKWGQHRTLQALNGMFAIAVWDRTQQVLTLARDRMGIKPLLWFRTSEGLFFASELKALLKDPACPKDFDHGSIGTYLRHGCVPAPWTIIKGVNKLMPGSVLAWKCGQEPTISQFWSPLDTMTIGQARLSDKSFDALVSEADDLIRDAVQRQMIADVPLGAFLSGGIDSSLVVAQMQAQAGRPVETFTIGFEEPEWDESPHAEAIARHIGTSHHTLRTSGHDALSLVEEIAGIYDEPFSDSSQIPTLLLCRLVRQHVTVALSGDGGDETFGGYARYGWGLKLNAYQGRVPSGLRQAAANLVSVAPMGLLDGIMNLSGSNLRNAAHKFQRAAALGAATDFVEGYRAFLSQTTDPQALLLDSSEHCPDAYRSPMTQGLEGILARMQTIDAMSYLPDDILVKVDRASMSAGLEVRVPLLDHRIWEWSSTLPDHVQRADGTGKAVLRAVLHRYVPDTLTNRPKAGFAVPLAQWLRGPLKEWAENLLSTASLAEGGIFRAEAVRSVWARHLAGRHDHGPLLWSILMFEAWRRSLVHEI